MELVKGFEYLVEGNEEINSFAKGILALVNVRSSREGIIHDFNTLEGTNKVRVVAYEEIEDYLTHHVGEILRKDEIEIVKIGFDNLNKETQRKVEGTSDLDTIITFNENF